MKKINPSRFSRLSLGSTISITLALFFQCTSNKSNPNHAIQVPAVDSSKKIEEVLSLSQNNNDYFLVKLIARTIAEKFPMVDSNALMQESGLAYFTMKPDSTIVFNSNAPGAGDGFFLGSFLQDHLISENGIFFKYRGDRLKQKSKQSPQDSGLTVTVLIPWKQLEFCRK